MTMHEFLTVPFVHGALIGLASAIGIDLAILKSAHTWSEFIGQYDWRIASFRYVQGIVFGGLAEAGLSGFFGI
jgi:hypothetical protein